jgi:hypothetical protein
MYGSSRYDEEERHHPQGIEFPKKRWDKACYPIVEIGRVIIKNLAAMM